MKFTVQELLNKHGRVPKGESVTVVGFLTVGKDARVYQAEDRDDLFVPVTDRRVADALLSAVPAYGGGPHIYADQAEIVSAVEMVDDAIVLSRVASITIMREQKWKVELEEIG